MENLDTVPVYEFLNEFSLAEDDIQGILDFILDYKNEAIICSFANRYHSYHRVNYKSDYDIYGAQAVYEVYGVEYIRER